MTHDPRVEPNRWKIRNIVSFDPFSVRINTIKNAAGRYETALFESDPSGRLLDIGIKYFKYNQNPEEAIQYHLAVVDKISELNTKGLSAEEIWSKIDGIEELVRHNGPWSYIMPSKNPPNVAIGQKPEDM
jgi:hypothetical protein